MNPKWLYRLESNDPDNGLWYDSNNNYVWGCKDIKGDSKFLPMGYDSRYHVDGKNWVSSCTNKEDILHWFSVEDANYLINECNFTFYQYLAVDYIEYDLETVFLKETAIDRVVIDINDLFNDRN